LNGNRIILFFKKKEKKRELERENKGSDRITPDKEGIKIAVLIMFWYIQKKNEKKKNQTIPITWP
jgi:hypothetical protein